MPRKTSRTARQSGRILEPSALPGMEALLRLPQAGPDLAGIDEAGRGCLAGPVVAAACVLPLDFRLEGLTDSKKLSAAQREAMVPIIKEQALAWGIGCILPARVDEINILQATFEAMARAVRALARPRNGRSAQCLPELLIIDGNKTIPSEKLALALGAGARLPRQRSVVGGDSRVLAVSAASVLAKTWRDQLMVNLAKRWPGYGFEVHMGYGTKAHMDALAKLGPCPMHRLSFRGVQPAETHASQCQYGAEDE